MTDHIATALKIATDLRKAERRVDQDPSDAAKEAGTYRKGHLKAHGLDITVENPKGSERSGMGRDGKRWSVKMPATYGYVKGSEGADGDHVDVYLGPDHASQKVFVVDQIDAETGKYDEHKCMLSYGSKADALADYKKAFSDGKGQDRIGAVTEMTVPEFQDWLKSGDTKKPLGLRKSYAAGGAVMPITNLNSQRNAVDKALTAARKAKKRAKGGRVGYYDGGEVDNVIDDLAFKSRLAKQRPDQRLAPDWREKLMSGAAGAADPLNIPSALTGLVSPETRDEWRAIEDRHLGMATAGGLATMTGVSSLLRPAIAAAKQSTMALTGAGTSAASDLIDEVGGKEGSVGKGTLAKAVVGGSAALPLRYGIPLSASAGGLSASDQAEAQTVGIKDRLLAMPADELKAYQRLIGAPPDGRVGPETLSKAMAHEAKREDEARRMDAQSRARADAEANNIRASGDAKAKELEAGIRAKALADVEAEILKNKGAADLRSSESKKPFLERNPGYSDYAPYVAGAMAAGIPALGALLTRRATTMPARQQAKTIDSAISRFEKAPTPLNARAVAEASGPLPEASKLSPFAQAMDYGSVGVGAAMPSAAVVAPYFIDYMQAPDTQAHKVAAEQFTVPKLVERMTGPFALGVTTAGAGRFLGDKAGGAFINPAARGANAAQAAAIKNIVAASPNDEALAGALRTASGASKSSFLEDMAGLPGRLSKAYNESQAAAGDAKSRALSVARDVQGLRQNAGRKDQLLDEAAALNAGATSGPLGSPSAVSAVRRETSEPVASPIRRNQTVYRGLQEDPVPQPGSSQSPASESSRPLVVKKTVAGYHYPAGHENAGQFVPHEIVHGAPKNTSKALPSGKGHGAGTKTLQVEGPKDPVKKEPVPRTKTNATAEDNLTDPDRLTRGMMTGGAVDRALAVAGRYSTGGHAHYEHGGSVHTGAVMGSTGGEADDVPISVPSGAYVIPAYAVSGWPGAGHNSEAGMAALSKIFGPPMKMAAAAGGAVPIKISHGEFVVSPAQVKKIGHGDLQMGHRTLDALMKKIKADNIAQLKTKPDPAV